MDKLNKEPEEMFAMFPTINIVPVIGPLLITDNSTPPKQVVAPTAPISPSVTIVIRKPLEIKKKKNVNLPKSGFTSKTAVEYREVIASQLEKIKTSPSWKEENAQPLNPATFAAMQPTSMSGWEYASTSSSAPDDRLVPTTIDEEEKMLQRAIAISIAEEQKKHQQLNPELYRVLTTLQEPKPTPSTSKSSTKSIIDWEKFGARPKRNFHLDAQTPSPTPTESDDVWHSDDEQTKKENQLTDTVKEFFQNAPKLIRNKLSPHFVPQLKLENLGRIDEETPSSPVEKSGSSSSSEESVVPDLESSASNYSPRISPLVSPMSSPRKNETETEIASDVSPGDAEVD